MEKKFLALEESIQAKGSLLVSYSGGVDSGLLAVLASEILRDQAICVFLDSPLVPRSAVEDAKRIAQKYGLNLELVNIPKLDEQVTKNPHERCYYCRKNDAQILKKRADALGISCIADGMNYSDLSDHRPGLRAADEEGIWHPFLEAGITKEQIRYAARTRHLDFWDKPSAACLSSRIPYGEEITQAKLMMVEQAEELLHDQGFAQVRVRYHAGIARIEAVPGDMEKLLSIRGYIAKNLKNAGFHYVALDLDGYRPGSMDEVLEGRAP
jgi:uncharacterized protein